MNSRKIFLLTVVFIIASIYAPKLQAQKFEELAQTPPMGWNSWNHFGCNVSEDLIKETADAMVETGMKEAGYEYVNIDDCWHGERDSIGNIQAHPERFSSGIKALADYVHSKGLKLGIYSDAGWQTCAGRPGSRGYEFQDARTYAKWGVDYLKYDWCNTEGLNQRGAYLTMRDALWKAGRPIVFSITEWGQSNPWTWAEDIGHLWRTTGDITNCFNCELDHGSWSSWGIMNILDMQSGLRKYAGPGHWNDPDMMEVGNGLTPAENRSHFSMWAMLSAPLIAGNDIRNMSEQTRKVLTNKEVIAVNQDSLGIQALRYRDYGDLEIWFKPLADGAWAMAVLNRSDQQKKFTFNWLKEEVADDEFNHQTNFGNIIYQVRDLWEHENIGTTEGIYTTQIAKHDIKMLKLTQRE